MSLDGMDSGGGAHPISLRMTSGSPRLAATAFTLFTFLLNVENLNLVSDLSSYLSWRGLKVLMEARTLDGCENFFKTS